MYDPEGFADFARARQSAMLRTAYLLCGDQYLAQDLVQTAFMRLASSWRRARSADVPAAYARRTLLNAYLDHRRRRFPWPFGDAVPELPVLVADTDDRSVVMAALAALPAGQRAVVVLRFWEDLSVEQTAELLRIAPGTVKSQTSKALDKLRSDPRIGALVAQPPRPAALDAINGELRVNTGADFARN